MQSFSVNRWEAEHFGVLRLTPEGAPVAVHIRLNCHDVLELRDLLNGATAMDALETMLDDVLGVPDQA